MLNALTSKFEEAFSKLRGKPILSESDVDAALEHIKTALLEADVNTKIARDFCQAIRKKAVGKNVLKSLNPEQTIVKFVYEELLAAMGEAAPISLRHAPPVVIMLVGLQGSGKTTSAGKLARFVKSDLKRYPLLVPADVYRPAAIEQLKSLGASLKVDVFDSKVEENPVDIARKALEYARNCGFDTLILDTAGRLQIDEKMMDELVAVTEVIKPHEILLVVDAMTGQEASKVALGFEGRLNLTGLVLTKLDGDARGGAALSLRAATGKPIKFVGMGEKLDALEVFYPDRMASRILGMGDIMTLIEKASKEVSVQDAKAMQKKFKKNEFSMSDFYDQLQSIKKMGSLSSLVGMIPGMNKVAKNIDQSVADKEIKRVEAIILSMTKQERINQDIIDGSRRKRIAMGSGTSVEDVNLLLKQFFQMKKIMKKMSNVDPKSLKSMRGLSNLLPPGMGFPR